MTSLSSVIAIDGPAASGKSTLGRLLAKHLGYLYFDTGVMYRALTWAALQRKIKISDEDAITRLAKRTRIEIVTISEGGNNGYLVLVDGEDVTNKVHYPVIDAHVSVVSAYPGVREALGLKQRRVGLQGNVVMVGRDIGTVVLPEAGVKIYLDASIEERARRRYLELRERGEAASMDEILATMVDRNHIDSTREVAPLKIAEDAVIIKTDGLSIEEVFERLKAIVSSC